MMESSASPIMIGLYTLITVLPKVKISNEKLYHRHLQLFQRSSDTCEFAPNTECVLINERALYDIYRWFDKKYSIAGIWQRENKSKASGDPNNNIFWTEQSPLKPNVDLGKLVLCHMDSFPLEINSISPLKRGWIISNKMIKNLWFQEPYSLIRYRRNDLL